MALGAGSAALDQIPNASGCQQHISTDQRGVARPQPAGGLCDIGAFEVVSAGAGSGAAIATPTMNVWALMIFVLLVGLGSLHYMRRR
jgi:hypothetical protein